jgi:DNA protecting protein DprA
LGTARNGLADLNSESQSSFFDQVSGAKLETPPSGSEDACLFLGLSRISGVGFETLRKFAADRSILRKAIETNARELEVILGRLGIRGATRTASNIASTEIPLLELGRREFDRLKRQGITLIWRGDDAFPQQLKSIERPPLWLFVQGNLELISLNNQVAIVGTRNPSSQGVTTAEELSRLLGLHGLTVVSGLAEGIDEAAHRALVELGIPNIAVLGNGIDVIFPSGSGPLRERILDVGGALITEYLPKDSYSRQRFVLRNRIQAGLTRAVIPVQAEVESGTAHTYRFAKQFGKDIFLVAKSREAELSGLVVKAMSEGHKLFFLDDMADRDSLLALLGSSREEIHNRPRVELVDRIAATLTELIEKNGLTSAEVAGLIDRIRHHSAT